ncbi:CoA transferase [Rhodococcus qingshengii]|uniref:CaiB/BaiF CoA transferase family protein n=1 Tax=Rhodococcus qingshengii TaxID=334542 RepID=UPI000AB68EA2|nr:CaiB/BaiF CoA-transferase family protein [Rhodococcus qingshengii]MCD2132329.1 CoA transferase [Rhodococcus qingshengii]
MTVVRNDEAESNDRPLNGMRVVDLTGSIAGPFCSQTLSALGADVIKIEHPTRGDDTRSWSPPDWGSESAAFLANNAGKRSIGIDLKSTEGRQVVLDLASQSHVFLQNLRPGLVDKLGIGFGDLSSVNDRIIYCTISAFGNAGERSSEPGYDPLMQAAAGIMSVTGEAGRSPVRAGVSLVDQGSALWAVIAILSAWCTREARDGPHLIETSLYETALNWMPVHVASYLANGTLHQPMGSGMAVIAPYEAYETANGSWLMIAAGNDRLFVRACSVLGLENLPTDERFHTNRERVRHRDELAAILGACLLARPASEWVAEFRVAGVPVSIVQTIDQVVNDQQTEALELLQPMVHKSIRNFRSVRPPLTINGTRVTHRFAPPLLGENSCEVLREIGYSDQKISDLERGGIIA